LAIGYCLLAIGYWLLSIGYWLLAIGYWLLAIGYWLLAIGYWLLAVGYWLLAIGYLQAIGYWLLSNEDNEERLEFSSGHTLVSTVRRNSLRVVVKNKNPEVLFFPWAFNCTLHLERLLCSFVGTFSASIANAAFFSSALFFASTSASTLLRLHLRLQNSHTKPESA
jgi:hypothetical protein